MLPYFSIIEYRKHYLKTLNIKRKNASKSVLFKVKNASKSVLFPINDFANLLCIIPIQCNMSEILRFNFLFQDKSQNIQVAAEKNSGKLICRCYGFFGMEDTIPDYRWDFNMDEGDWDKLVMIINDANATKWESGYIDQSVEDGPEWSLEIHVLGKHTISEGYNKFPKEFESLKQDMINFLKMKRRQLKPDIFDFRYLAVAEQRGLECPIVMVDRMEKTFTFYNFFETLDNDGTYFMTDGDWENIQEIVLKHAIFDKFEGLPPANTSKVDSQYSVSVGYKPGQITQRFCGTEPAWWRAFADELFDLITKMFTEGRKPADQNFGMIN